MSSLIAAIVNGVIHRILRVAGSLSYGTLVLPYDEEVVWPAVRARRVPPLLQWAIERDNFESDVVNGYAAMEDGAARQLVAGTGVGKSTVLPYRITSQMGVSGIMLMPNNELPVMCMAHLRTKFVEWGGTVTPVILRTQHATSPLPAPTLYLSSASDFLGRLAKRPSLIQDLGVDFIYLDESHEVRPEYIFFRYAKEAGLFGTVKVFFGTATAAGDLNMESGGVGRSVVAKPVNMFPMSSPRSVSAQSPLHYSNICNRTLVFVATDAEAVAWAEYYDQHDVPVMHYLVEEGAHLLPRIGTHLSQNPLCVLLVPSFFQTGFTLNVDTVIDTGYVSELRMEHENKRMILVKRPVTQAERTQRMGRVGRFKPGRGYYADIEVSRPVSDEAPEVAMYVFLWSRVFNMQINEPTIRDFEQLTGEITPKAAAVLLHSRVHPYLLLPYVANDGFFVGWGKVLKYTLYSSMAIDGDESNADKVQSWAEYGTGPVDYATAPFKYKCAIKFPAEWSVIPAVAWKFFSRDVDDVTLRGLSGRSVISAITARTEVSPARVRRSLRISTPPQSPVLSQYSSATLPAYAGTQTPPPAFTSVEDVSSVSVPSIRELQNAYSVQSVAPALRESTVAPTVREASVAPSRRGVESVSRWRRDVPARTHHRKISGSGSSSNDREEIPLKQVDPAKYMYNKLYPMDPTVFDNYIADEMVTKNDHRRVENLLQGKRDFSSLPDDATSLRGRQETYFISVLRVHNSAVSRKLQLSSNLRPGFIAKITNSFTADLEFEDSRIRSTVRLLKACALQSFFVGVDSRSMHASITSSVVVPSYNEYASRARIMLAFGPPEVMHAVDQLVTAAVPCMDDLGWCAANAWAIDNYVVAVAHSVDEDDESTWPPNAESVHVMDVERDLIVFKSSVTGTSPYIRYAKLYEPVYIMYFDAEENRITVIGDFTVVSDSNPIQVDFVLTHGCSGAAVVAVSDGALLGFYRGRYADGVSWVIPSPFIQAHVFGGTE